MENRTELNSMGKFSLLQHLQQQIPNPQHLDTVAGMGEDASVLEQEKGYKVFANQLFIENIHFDLGYFSLKHVGYKAVVTAISPIVAMNALPSQLVLNIALTNRFSVEALDALMEGVHTACQNYKIDVIGLDVSNARSGLVLSMTAVGNVEKNGISYRKGAKPNDIICTTGDFGAAYVGLQVLEREKKVFLADPNMQPELEGYEYILQRQMRPDTRTDVLHELKELGIVPSSMTVVKDGLASDLLNLCKASQLGASIFEEKIPIDDRTYLASTELNINPMTSALNGGDDYELLFTIQQADYEKIKNLSDILPIGYMTEDKNVDLILKSGNKVALQAPAHT